MMLVFIKIVNHLSAICILCAILLLTITAAGAAQSVTSSVPVPVAYVSSSMKNNDVAAISMSNYTVLATIPVGTAPIGLAVSPDNGSLYVTNSGDNTLTVINISTNRPVATINVGNTPYSVAVSPDGRTVYVSNSKNDTVSVIDAATDMVTATIKVGSAPWGIKTNPRTGDVYVLNQNDGTVSIIYNNNIKATIPVGKNPGVGLAVSSDGTRLYVANADSNNVSVIDTSTNKVVTSINTGSGPYGLALSPNGSYLYVTELGDQAISVVRTKDYNISATYNASYPSAIAVRPDGKVLYVSDAIDGCLLALDASNGTELANKSFGDLIADIAVAVIGQASGQQASATPSPSAPASNASISPTATSVSVTPVNTATSSQPAGTQPGQPSGQVTVTSSASAGPSGTKRVPGFEACLAALALLGAVCIANRKG